MFHANHSSKIRCKVCHYSTMVLHQIVPPELFGQHSETLASIVMGCKNKEQKLVCPQCQSVEFEKEEG